MYFEAPTIEWKFNGRYFPVIYLSTFSRYLSCYILNESIKLKTQSKKIIMEIEFLNVISLKNRNILIIKRKRRMFYAKLAYLQL